MSYLFSGCNKITEVDLSNFDTNQVTNMTGMFLSSGIKQIDVSNFDTSKVTAMAGMFYSMPLTQLDISSFNTNLVTNMRQLFQYCNKLEYLNLGENFVINENTDIGQMFAGISSNIRITAITSTKEKILEKYPNLENNFE